MALGHDVRCLYSTVKNTSGKAKTFGFLPPHGRKLAIGESFNIFGDVQSAMFRFERTEGRRNVIALEQALQRGDITIVKQPNPILLDDANPGSTKMIILHNGALALSDVCWLSSTSLNPPLG
jgi:hypothetical protein